LTMSCGCTEDNAWISQLVLLLFALLPFVIKIFISRHA
jgi:hypothetical protein